MKLRTVALRKAKISKSLVSGNIAKSEQAHKQPNFLVKFLASKGVPIRELHEIEGFFASRRGEKLSIARSFIEDSIINAASLPGLKVAVAFQASEHMLPGYSTLDSVHCGEIEKFLTNIKTYLGDPSRRRPLNFLMLASPGSGKSHFIKQLARKLKPDRVEAVTFNMTSMQTHSEMARPLDELRNLKINDRFPILFLDEFDTKNSNYATLLPLLWDGELQIGPRDLKIGKAVIVLAGSRPNLPGIMRASGKMNIDDLSARGEGKLIDLLSRINGGTIEIPDLDLRADGRDRRADKVCLAISLTKARFGNHLTELPRVFLRFIAHTRFRFGVRSIAHLIDSIDSSAVNGTVMFSNKLGLPFSTKSDLLESSLKLHVSDENKAVGIVTRWNSFAKNDCNVCISNDDLSSIRFDPESGEPISYG